MSFAGKWLNLRVCNEITYPIMEFKKIETTRLREDYHKINLVEICVILVGNFYGFKVAEVTS